MSFISYAQNFEDVMLWRALKDVKNGFYIDIGANDPVKHSVTKAMYDLGWHGINCEPVAHWFEKLEQERIHDINIQVAIGAENTELTFYEVVDTGLSTLNEKLASKHAKELGYKIKEYLVPVQTLTSICEKKSIDTIHFLKIDVEGAEKSVLEGINFKKIRPWIIVIEATKPMSENTDFENWENLITSQNYHFIYFDGLNRFYVADEHTKLDSSFQTPPNIFDRFTLISEINARKENEKKYNLVLEERNKWWEKVTLAEKKLEQLEHQSFLDIEVANKKTHEWWEKATLAEKKLEQLEHQSFLENKRLNSKIKKLMKEYDILNSCNIFQRIFNKIKG
jgi:FkbM family methyltransferase